MSPERWERVREVFDAVVDLDPVERVRVLDALCGGDGETRAEVERLLRLSDSAGDFLEEPLIEPGRSLGDGDVVAQRYEIKGLLGRGGMGEVYEAHDRLLREAIAFKTIRPDLAADRRVLERFQKEITAARRVTHPNVCRVYEVGVDRGIHYFTMELLVGETLAARLRRDGRLRAEAAVPLIRQMALGLDAAHEAGVIHRDFKSANVMLVGGRAVITDFGLARATGAMAATASADTAVSTTQLAGTVGYMSPEQMRGAPVTAASDIYSFGIVMYEMAAGKLPFDDSNVLNSAMQRGGRIPDVRAEAPEAGGRWASAIERCLQPEADRRFATAGEIAAHFARGSGPAARMRLGRRQVAVGSAVAATAAVGGIFWPGGEYTPKPEAVSWYEKGVDSALSMTYEASRKALEQAVSVDPGYAPAHAYLAAADAELDDPSSAKEAMLKAMSAVQAARFGSGDRLRVRTFERLLARDLAGAIEAASQLAAAARTIRERAAAHVQLAWIEQKRQDLAATRKNLEEALKLDSTHAGAHLRLAIVYNQEQKPAQAGEEFAAAERLFRAASNQDGVTGVLWHHARFLARIRKPAEALAMAKRGLAIAESTGNRYSQIRLRLVQALAYRNAGDLARSREVAEQAVRTAAEYRMDATAAVGLLDLGNAHLLRDEREAAERYFLQGLQAARTGRADFSEARAGLSLASLYVQYGRPAKALAQIDRALPYFRDGGHQRETMQGLLLLGGVQTQLAHYDEARRTLQEALERGEQLGDREQHGLAYGFMAAVLTETGQWPAAVTAQSRALELFGDLRGGYRAAHILASRARVRGWLGQFPEARSDMAEARRWADRAPGNQAQVRANLTLAESEMAYMQGDWKAAAVAARRAGAVHGDGNEDRQAALIEALATFRNGGREADVRRAIAAFDHEGGAYWAARGRLLFAEASGDRAAAGEALQFFEPRQNWEAIWRCRRAMGGGVEHGPAQRAALEELRRSWGAEGVAGYVGRPDVKSLLR
ncbi:MAG: protein kinase [Bryobacteraceae bacterium]